MDDSTSALASHMHIERKYEALLIVEPFKAIWKNPMLLLQVLLLLLRPI